MTIYAVSGFQTDAPHWHVAYIEADSADEAAAALLAILTDERRRPDEVWGWDEASHPSTQDWRIDVAKRPFRFVLGGGCR